MKRSPIKLNLQFRLLSSASHIGNTGGIDAEFHRVEIMQPDGSIAKVPCFTGNSIRGRLRDESAFHLMDSLEIERLPLKTFYMLMSGGSLEKGLASVSLEKARQLRSLLPSISLWGAASGNHIMEGNWTSGFIQPHARETASILGLDDNAHQVSVYDLMRTQEYTRMDDAKSVRKAHLIQAEEAQVMLVGLEAKRTSGVATESGQSQQMRYRVETMIAGVTLSWRVTLKRDTSILEEQALYAALATWGQDPTLGGKVAVGHGLVELHGPGISISPDEVSVPSYAAYEEHLRAHAQEIKALLYG